MATSDFEEFSGLLSQFEESEERAPSSLKARLYSLLVRKQQESGPLASLQVTVSAGHSICVFERLVQIAPVGEKVKSPFFATLVMHASLPSISTRHPYSGKGALT